MRNVFMMAAVAATAAIAVPAVAQDVSAPAGGIILINTAEMEAGFDNRGQCQSTFRQLRNDQRKSGNRGSEEYNAMSNGEYNNASRTTTRCEQLEDGRYYVVYYPNGI